LISSRTTFVDVAVGDLLLGDVCTSGRCEGSSFRSSSRRAVHSDVATGKRYRNFLAIGDDRSTSLSPGD